MSTVDHRAWNDTPDVETAFETEPIATDEQTTTMTRSARVVIVACHSCGNPVHSDHHVWDCATCSETREFCCECEDAEDTSCRREYEHDHEPEPPA